MPTIEESINVKLVIDQVEIAAAAERKIQSLTNLRLGLPTGTVLPAGSPDLKATAAAMGKAGIGGQSGIMGLANSFSALIGSITGLAGIIKMALDNSKIIQMFMNTIGKALGLLVDVILMPFLPVISLVLLALFKGIMEFKKMWDSFWVSGPGKTIIDWMKSVLTLGSTELTGQSAEVMIKASEDATWWKNFLTVGVKEIAFKIFGTLDKYFKWIWGLIFGVEEGEQKSPGIINLAVKFIEAADPIAWISAIILALMGHPEGLVRQFTIVANFIAQGDSWVSKYITGPISSYVTRMGGSLSPNNRISWDTSNTSGDFRPPMKFMARGGYVDKTGPAFLHKGETVIPKGGGITVNITGQFKSDEDMYRRFVDRLRQEQWRTNV
jgi:hypothetical protein